MNENRMKDKITKLGDKVGKIKLYVAQTPYHLMISCSRCSKNDYLIYIGSFQENETLKKIVNKTFDHDKVKEILPLSHYKNNIKNLVLFRTKMKNSLKEYQEIKIDNIFVYNDLDPIVQWIMHYIDHKTIVLIEEGIGLYRDVIKQNEVIFRLFGRVLFSHWYENINRIGTSSLINIIECSNPSGLNEKQKGKKIREFSPVQFHDIAESIGLKQYKGQYWFVGQPLVEDGVVDNAQYVQWLNTVLSLPQNSDAEWVIKPHPRENMQKYRECNQRITIIEDNKIPIELLINTEKEIKIFSFYSSALLSLSKMKNIQCYAICKVKDKGLVGFEIIKMFNEYGINIISI